MDIKSEAIRLMKEDAMQPERALHNNILNPIVEAIKEVMGLTTEDALDEIATYYEVQEKMNNDDRELIRMD